MTEQLETATFGRTGVDVTRLGYGAMELRAEPRGRPLTSEQAGAVLNAVLDSGINFIDTADCYGRAEEFIGEHLSHRRSEYTLATKCGCILTGGKEWASENLLTGLERSLKRMKTDHVDVMQLHGATVEDCEKGGLVETLQMMNQEGKVRWIGASTHAEQVGAFIDTGAFDAFQLPYSAFSRGNEPWITQASNAGIGTIIRGGVAKGEPGPDARNPERFDMFSEAGLDDLREEGESRTGFMLRFTLSHPDIHTIIVGTQKPVHLKENVRAALRGPLSDDMYAEAKRRLDAAGSTV